MRLRAVLSASILALVGCAAMSAGCGYSEQQWQVQIDKYEHERARRDAAEDRMAKSDAELDDVRSRSAALEERLVSAGIDPERLDGGAGASAEERDRAVAEMKARAARFDAIRGRYESLKQKVAGLAVPGAAVVIRKNRVVVVLPGDALFDGSKDTIKKGGRDALAKLAEGIKNDAGLVGREYQVRSHTDSKRPSGGAFSDNLGLSAMRARAVVLFLTDGAGGALAREKWSAAGYGDHEAVAPNDSDDGRAANRRLEIVVMPSADEVADLRGLAGAPATPVAAPAAPAAAPKATPKKEGPAPGTGTTPPKATPNAP